jgi:alkaline phosphatase D
VAASGKKDALASFFTRFLLNCDQWDGYNSERKTLMAHLKTNNIGNVVALTGDIHSFFAGTVNDDFDATGGGTPVMVDLVSAGISSDSFFSYLRDAAATLGDIGTLVSYPLAVPVTGWAPQPEFQPAGLHHGQGCTDAGFAAGTNPRATARRPGGERRAGSAAGSDRERRAGRPASQQRLQHQPAGLAQQLSGLGNNQWLKHLNTDAQGYTLVTLTPEK